MSIPHNPYRAEKTKATWQDFHDKVPYICFWPIMAWKRSVIATAFQSLSSRFTLADFDAGLNHLIQIRDGPLCTQRQVGRPKWNPDRIMGWKVTCRIPGIAVKSSSQPCLFRAPYNGWSQWKPSHGHKIRELYTSWLTLFELKPHRNYVALIIT